MAWRAAADCGVTRLAEVTRLDRIGLPVWQAIRPMSRALSVHQGKGATDTDAQLGALLEAVESHHAEQFVHERATCRFDELSHRARPPVLADFARDRREPPAPDAPHRWSEATNIVSGEPFYLPFELVSLDLSRDLPSAFDRASDGLAAGSSREEAISVAIHEIIERDAVAAWLRRGLVSRTADALDIGAIDLDWFRGWAARIEAAGAGLGAYYLSSVTGTPVVVCEISDFDKTGDCYRAVHGSGCHPHPELALFKALTEAIQSRATMIAGAREDLFPSDYVRKGEGAFLLALPASPMLPQRSWLDVASGPVGVEAVVAVLAEAGYDQVAVRTLGTPEGLHVVKAFVCGLGARERSRRPIQGRDPK